MRCRVQTVSILCAVFGAAYSLPCAGQVSLVRDGEARAVIVRAEEPSEMSRYAVQELVWHMKRATGVELEVLPESETSTDVHTRTSD
jgi:hypothetical protein